MDEASKAVTVQKFIPSSQVTAGCLALALLLHLSLTQWGIQHLTTYCDDHTTVTSGPTGHPVFTLSWEVADTSEGLMAGFARNDDCNVRAFSSTTGLFPRTGLPHAATIIAGLIFPFALVCYAAFLLFKGLRGRMRRIVAIILAILGTTLALPVIALLSSAAWDGALSTWDSQLGPLVIFVAVIATVLLAGSIWLWRDRSPKQPA